MILREVEIDGVRGLDVRVQDGRITEIGPSLVAPGSTEVVDGNGGALLPGLHDHHLHLRALAAVARSVPCGPPDVTDADGLVAVLRRAAARVAPGGWIRAVGYDERIAGPLDRDRLDAIVDSHPLRLQHRSGHLWVLNTAALERLAGHRAVPPSAARDGLLYDADRLFHGVDTVSPEGERAALAEVSRRLAAFGITGVTDATAANDPTTADLFDALRKDGTLHQHVALLGGDDLPGPRKVILAEHDLPALDDLVTLITGAHAAGRPVALHAASRVTVVLALAALDAAGTRPGDRLEHASVAPPEAAAWMARLGVTVVTQPGFVAAHGDRYLDEVEADDRPWLYRGQGFLAAGVALAAGSDAPFGPDDPWRSMQAAVDRCTAGGRRLSPAEALTPEAALALHTGSLDDPGGPPRRVAAGAVADLCLLSVPWVEARGHLTADLVTATIVEGALVRGG